jgi:hypothetical protein
MTIPAVHRREVLMGAAAAPDTADAGDNQQWILLVGEADAS